MENVRNIFDNFIVNLQLVIDQLKDGETERVDTGQFNHVAYWERLDKVVKALSGECTKFCMAYSKPPLPSNQDCESLITRVQNAILALVSAYYALPKTQGITVRKRTKEFVYGIVVAVKELIDTIRNEGPDGSQKQLQSTGAVWEKCEEFHALAKTNQQAVQEVVQDTIGLVKDALEELEEAMQEETEGRWGDMDDLLEAEGQMAPDNEDTWTDADKTLLAPCLGLVKASKLTLNKINVAVKTNGDCSTELNISQFDDLVDITKTISPNVDDFVSVLYAPMQHLTVRLNAEKLAVTIKNLLELSRHMHINKEDDQHWVEFLQTAAAHNLEKIQGLTDSEDIVSHTDTNITL
ncbi:unnamed protein product [Owenia fusiformis]|uniref:Uncharacterized protein n=1 Tax=Owenia fusiformis TaxID=6347 RepID=A0A8J1TTE3_OWEFU|nr:unnamed protein product [Owenia fusiformis]